MSKFTCLVLCAVAVSLSRVCAVEEDDHLDEFLVLVEECSKLHGISDDDLNDAMNTYNVAKIKPCFWGCAFTKVGFLNSKGQYDLDSGLISVKRFTRNSVTYSLFEKVARQCESVKDKAVSDGETGCERGMLAAACFMEQLQKPESHQ